MAWDALAIALGGVILILLLLAATGLIRWILGTSHILQELEDLNQSLRKLRDELRQYAHQFSVPPANTAASTMPPGPPPAVQAPPTAKVPIGPLVAAAIITGRCSCGAEVAGHSGEKSKCPSCGRSIRFGVIAR